MGVSFYTKKILINLLNRRIVWKSFDSAVMVFQAIRKLGNFTTEPTSTIAGRTIGIINHPMMDTLMLLSF